MSLGRWMKRVGVGDDDAGSMTDRRKFPKQAMSKTSLADFSHKTRHHSSWVLGVGLNF